LNRLILKIFFVLCVCISTAQYSHAIISSGLIDKPDGSISRALCFTPQLNDEFFAKRLEKIKRDNPSLYQRMLMPRTMYRDIKSWRSSNFFC